MKNILEKIAVADSIVIGAPVKLLGRECAHQKIL